MNQELEPIRHLMLRHATDIKDCPEGLELMLAAKHASEVSEHISKAILFGMTNPLEGING